MFCYVEILNSTRNNSETTKYFSIKTHILYSLTIAAANRVIRKILMCRRAVQLIVEKKFNSF